MFDFAFRFSPVAFSLFGKDIYWYGIIITVGIILGVIYAFQRAKQSGINSDHMYDYAIFTVIFGVIGARLYYVLANLDTYNSFKDIIAVWNGGLGIYGGVIAGIATITIVAFIKKQKALRVLDCAAPAAMIGQILGRWGNYANQEAFGINTDLPWGMRSFVYEQSATSRLQGTVEYLEKYQSKIMAENPGMVVNPEGFVHPTFLYESLWNLLGFILINIFYKKKKFDGQIFLTYIGWYGLGRMFIEGLRTDSLYIGTVGSGIRLSQLVAFICVVLSVFFIVLLMIKAKSNGVTSLYTKLPNGKWIMTDAIQQISEEAEKEASDENADGGDICEESPCGDENNEDASLDDEDIEDESAEDASSDEEAEKTEDSEVTKDETEKTEGEN